MKEYSKDIRKKLRHWAAEAYSRELSSELKNLHAHFHKWESGELSPFELSDLIHTFHQDAARRIWVKYETTNECDLLVVYAVRDQFIQEEELEPEVLEALTPQIESARKSNLRILEERSELE